MNNVRMLIISLFITSCVSNNSMVDIKADDSFFCNITHREEEKRVKTLNYEEVKILTSLYKKISLRRKGVFSEPVSYSLPETYYSIEKIGYNKDESDILFLFNGEGRLIPPYTCKLEFKKLLKHFLKKQTVNASP